MQDDMNVNIRALYNVSDDPAVLQSFVEKLIGDKYNIIVGTALGYSDVFKVLAAKHPDVAFLNAAGSTNAPNLESFYPRTYESLFLCGMAAGAVSKSGKLGYVATVRRGLVHWAVSAYELGARDEPGRGGHDRLHRPATGGRQDPRGDAGADQGQL